MIELYTWNTPNGQKPAILLEELGLEYLLHPVDIANEQQFSPNFVSINPNSKIPALMGTNGRRIFESGAILVALADEQARFLPSDSRNEILSWVFWQVGGLGPMIGQWGHFANAEGDNSYAKTRYFNEVTRLLNVLELRLQDAQYLGGDAYSIADIASWPWVAGGLQFMKAFEPAIDEAIPSVLQWRDAIQARPAVQTALSRLRAATAR